MAEGRLKYGFLNNHPILVKTLPITSLLPDFYSQGLVTQNEKAMIQKEAADGMKADKFLDIIHRQGVINPQVYQTLLDMLSDEYLTSGMNLGRVVEQVKKDSLSDEVAAKFVYAQRMLPEDDKVSLLKHKWTIVQSLTVEELLPELISKGAISLTDKEEIRSESTPNEQALKLFSIIMERGSYAYRNFVAVLLDSDRHRNLGEMLSGTMSHIPLASGILADFPVEETLKRGHVPPRQGVYVERKEVIGKIRNALHQLKDQQEGWVLVHGIAGFGKTVLAAEAVRDENILSNIFPGGVHWLTVGKLSDHDGDIDRGKLLSKLQTLVVRLDTSNSNRQLDSVEAAKDYLQKVIDEQYPKTLLILDDVWSHDVINAFSVRCRILVTSRVAGLISPIMVKNVYPVPVSDGFSEAEGKQLLALWLEKKPQELSAHSDEILKYCRGSPMAIALIGAMLRKNSTERKWAAIAKKMESKHLIMSTENWDHHTLKASIELSVDSLPEELQEHFKMLTVFDYDTAIPLKVLETVWDVDDFDAEEHMNVIMDYSLAQRCVTVEEESSPFYSIHDIILDYLKESISSQEKRKLHQCLVDRYEAKCSGAFSKLDDDKYIFKKLIGHIISAGNFELLGELLSQLKWVISNVVYGDANLLLAHYKDYKSKVPQNFQIAVQKFELFLSGHMFVLANSPKRDDILQLALLQPDDSDMYMQAVSITKDQKRKSWFKWSNKDSDPEKYALKLKLHSEGVSKCQFTGDGTKVLSCAGTEVKLWDSSTGMVSANFVGHTDRVTCCAIVSKGGLLVSCSEDNTVKVWEPKTKRLVCDFREHMYGVQSCAFSPDGRWVLSADIDSVIILWEALLGKVLKKWRLGVMSPALTPTPESVNKPPDFSSPSRSSSQVSQESCGGSGEGVLCCNFSPDCTQFVTSSQNGMIRLWDLASFCQILTFRGHSTQVKCCVFSRTGNQLASASFDHTAKVWETRSGQCTATLDHGEEVVVLSCDFSQDASRLITGDTNGSVKVWSLPHGVLIQDLPLHWDYVNCVLFAPNTQHILSAADNGIIKILWNEDLEDQGELISSAVQYHRRFSTHFVKEGSTYEPLVLCYIQKDNKLQIVKGSKAVIVYDSLPAVAGANPRCWVFSNAGDKIVVGYVQGILQLMEIEQLETGKWDANQIWKAEGCHSKEVLKCFFSPDDTKIVSCSHKEHKVWNVSNGQLIACIAARGIGVKPCIFLGNSTQIVSIQESNALLWDCNTGSSLVTFKYDTQEDTILCINLSKDDKRLVASTTSGLVMVWSISGEVMMKSVVMPLSACARSCSLSPDGSLAVAGYDDGSLKIWNVSSGREVAHQFTGSQYWMIDVVFSPDGSNVVSLCDSIEWWKNDGTYLKRVLLKGTFGKYIRFSPDFMTFVTIDNAGLLYILKSI